MINFKDLSLSLSELMFKWLTKWPGFLCQIALIQNLKEDPQVNKLILTLRDQLIKL